MQLLLTCIESSRVVSENAISMTVCVINQQELLKQILNTHLNSNSGARLAACFQWCRYGDISIKADGAHVHDRGCAHHHIQHLVQITDHQTKRPVPCKYIEDCQIKIIVTYKTYNE